MRKMESKILGRAKTNLQIERMEIIFWRVLSILSGKMNIIGVAEKNVSPQKPIFETKGS